MGSLPSRRSLSVAAILCGGLGLHAAGPNLGPGTSAPFAPGSSPAVRAATTGQPGSTGDFDWCVAPGETLVLDTSFATLVGGAHCAAATRRFFSGGLVDVRHVWIQEGARVRVVGPNPLVVHASGSVRIDGTLDLSGVSSAGVTTLNTTQIPEQGAPGVAGGGRGGLGSPLVTASSPAGGRGLGAFNTVGRGGGGGETGWNNVSAALIDGRRGAGGGGGAFGPDQRQSLGSVDRFGDWDQGFIGLDAESGFGNLDANANGALTGAAGPKGGRPGPRPFQDSDTHNDFYGQAVDLETGEVILGELPMPWAGSGGGGGGDAAFVGLGGSFPALPFDPTGDEKGAGGGGGGGSLQLLVEGDIVFGPNGLILARGGSGGGGENSLFLNRVGGGSGGGSGGHVILQAGGVIDLRLSLGQAAGPGVLVGGILATGGQGGAGRGDVGGARLTSGGITETSPSLDACPGTLAGGSYPSSGPNACRGLVDGAGGDGGPGLIQLHTRTGLDADHPSILLPNGVAIGDLMKPTPVCSEPGCHLVSSLP